MDNNIFAYSISSLLNWIVINYLFIKTLGVKSNRHIKKILIVQAFVLLIDILVFSSLPDFQNMLINLSANTSIAFVLTMVIALQYASAILKKVAISIIAMLYGILSEILSSILGYIFAQSFPFSNDVIDFISSRCIYAALIYFVALLVPKGVLLNKQKWIGFIAMPIVSIVFIYSVYLPVFTGQHDISAFTSISTMLILVAAYYNLYVLHLLDTEGAKQQRIIQLTSQVNAYVKQFDLISSSQNKVKKLNHNIKAVLLAIKNSILSENKQEALNMISESLGELSHKDAVSDSGNLAVDSILNYFVDTARKNEIGYTVQISIPTTIDVNSYDITNLLFNSLENAFYATKKLEGDKKVEADIEYKKGMLLINISNTFNGTIKVDADSFPISTKRGHYGIGMRTIDDLCKRLKGGWDYTVEEDTFTLTVWISTFEKGELHK